MRLTIYGDFNCPFSALASARADLLLTTHEIDWRAVQHDPAIPSEGRMTDGALATELATEIEQIRELSEHDVRLHLAVPRILPNTARASSALAGAGADATRLRRRVFAAVWAEGRDIGQRAELRRIDADWSDPAVAMHWQLEFDALPRPITPTLVLPDGYVSRGLGALTRLADLAAPVSTGQ